MNTWVVIFGAPNYENRCFDKTNTSRESEYEVLPNYV